MSVSMSLRAPLAAALLLVCAGAQAATDLKERVAELAEAQGDRLESTFKHLHANPELGFQETETAKMVSKRLKKLGYKVHTGIGGTGVAAVLKNGDGPVVMFRSDMDGLPLKEETDLDYASRKQVTLDDGSKVTLKGNEQVEYDGEIHTAANLFDALKEGTYGKY